MQQYPQYQQPAPQRKGCTTWIAVAALVLVCVNFAWDFVQEMAWDAAVGQATGNVAPVQTSQVSVSSGQTPAPTSSPVPTSTPAPPSLPAVGVDVMAGSIRWKILSAENMGSELTSDNQFVDPKRTTGKYIKIVFEVENRGSDSASYGHFDLVDRQGRTFSVFSEMYFFLDDGDECSSLDILNPNLSRRCTVIFEVAADAVGLRAYVGDLNMFTGGEAYIELGF